MVSVFGDAVLLVRVANPFLVDIGPDPLSHIVLWITATLPTIFSCWPARCCWKSILCLTYLLYSILYNYSQLWSNIPWPEYAASLVWVNPNILQISGQEINQPKWGRDSIVSMFADCSVGCSFAYASMTGWSFQVTFIHWDLHFISLSGSWARCFCWGIASLAWGFLPNIMSKSNLMATHYEQHLSSFQLSIAALKIIWSSSIACFVCCCYVVTTDGTDCFLRISDDAVSEKCWVLFIDPQIWI
jgi:hypothetical protein